MNYYQEKFEKLLKEASDCGYKFNNGKFLRNDSDFIPVMEIFTQWHTTYEAEGTYYIYKNTFEIEEKDYKEIIDWIKKHSDNDYNLERNEELYDLYENIILKYLNKDRECDCFETTLDGNVHTAYDTFDKYSGEDECVDLWLSPKQEPSEFPQGYISFYKITKKDFDKTEKVNLILDKFMKYN